MKDTVIYIGSFQFPYGDAVAKRVHGVGKALSLAGYSVVFIGEDKQIDSGTISPKLYHDEFIYYSIHKPGSAIQHYDYRRDLKNVKVKIDEYNQTGKLAAVIFCGTKNAFFADGIVKYCKKKSITTIADSTDWLTARTGNILFDLIKKFDIMYELKKVNRQADGVMAISMYLQNFYNTELPTIVIPPLSPYERPENEWKTSQNSKICFIYAGIPCRLDVPLKDRSMAKDRLDIAIEAFYRVAKNGKKFIFSIYGMTKDQYIVIFPDHKEIVNELTEDGSVEFKGYSDEATVKNAVINSDYTVLLRGKNKTTMAGFPTKISESIFLGTPVLTNDTSDILKYLTKDIELILVEIDDIDKIVKGIENAIDSCISDRKRMKQNALQNMSFSPVTYSACLDEFVKSLI